MKNIKDLSEILGIEKQKNIFNNLVDDVLIIIKKETNINISNKNILLNNNILKIKTNSNNKFVLFLNLDKINQSLKSLKKDIILEL